MQMPAITDENVILIFGRTEHVKEKCRVLVEKLAEF